MSKIIGQARIVILRRRVPDNMLACQLLANTIEIVPAVQNVPNVQVVQTVFGTI